MEQTSNSLYLVMVDPTANNNKYYKMIKNGDMFDVQFGRVGNTGYQTSQYPMSRWESTLKSKIKKGYSDQTRLVAETIIKNKAKEYLDIPDEAIASIVTRLQAMARQAISDNYTITSNKVTKVMVNEAQITIDNLVKNEDIDVFNKILVELFMIIPRKMGKVKDYLAKNKEDIAVIIQREQDLLDVMRGQVIQETVTEEVHEDSPINNRTILESMGLRIEKISKEDEILIKNNLGSDSKKFYQAWKVINIKTQDKFDKFVVENDIKNNKLLWHGSRNENWWSIINTGLVLRPSAAINGKMFGYGIYFASKAQKSIGYTSLNGSYWAGGSSKSAFMSLYSVAYGKPYDVHSFEDKFHNLNYKKLQENCKGANCLHAHAGNMLRNDEIIVYKEDQITIKYLVEIK